MNPVIHFEMPYEDGERLEKFYTNAGFDFLGMFRLKNTAGLPMHYQEELNCCLFEIRI